LMMRAKRGSVFRVLEETGKDPGGRWYRVGMPDGGTAWVSSAVAKRELPVNP
jgi:hypothetical protein